MITNIARYIFSFYSAVEKAKRDEFYFLTVDDTYSVRVINCPTVNVKQCNTFAFRATFSHTLFSMLAPGFRVYITDK